jgi:RNA polymerase sigma-70 factor (ECF subfamily)
MDRVREQALVARSRTDASAFGELYDYYLPRLHGYVLRRSGDRTMAEDVISTTFERALEVIRQGSFRNESFGGWLYRVASNALVDHLRRSARTVPLGLRAGDAWDDERGDLPSERSNSTLDIAEASFSATLDRDQLSRALQRLPDAHRRLIVLQFFDGLERDELCAVLDCSPATYAVRLHRALRALRTLLAEESTDAA